MLKIKVITDVTYVSFIYKLRKLRSFHNLRNLRRKHLGDEHQMHNAQYAAMSDPNNIMQLFMQQQQEDADAQAHIANLICSVRRDHLGKYQRLVSSTGNMKVLLFHTHIQLWFHFMCFTAIFGIDIASNSNQT